MPGLPRYSHWLMVPAVLLVQLTPRPGVAQVAAPGEDAAAVLAAAQSVLDAINTRDGGRAAEILVPEGAMVRVIPTPDGGRPEAIPNERFIRTIGQPGPVLRERMWAADVRIHGPIATVWAAYEFHIDGAFSHCGINVFSLVQSGQEWQVASVVYTVERERCPDSPPGQPGS
jgi:hypothetical protein